MPIQLGRSIGHFITLWLLATFPYSLALQSGQPFARHSVLSAATPVDCDFGSGVWPDLLPNLCGGYGIRYGEAQHPGPAQSEFLTIGVSNPGGLRQKESHLLDLGPGIVTMKTCAHTIRQQALSLNRQVRVNFGAPAPLRTGSQWAGSWTGVCASADWPSAKLEVTWPDDHFATGRVLLTRHWVTGLPITVGTYYGYPQGPTWPKAKSLNDKLLATFTQEVVLGMSGVRVIQGDFNFDPEELPQQRIWRCHGWCNAQTIATELLQHEATPTCKHATERDQIWLSPEAVTPGIMQIPPISSSIGLLLLKIRFTCSTKNNNMLRYHKVAEAERKD